MGEHADNPAQRLVNWLVVGLIVALNIVVLWWGFAPH
jgi:Mn2+/Fe2+ NRAMP family transporter